MKVKTSIILVLVLLLVVGLAYAKEYEITKKAGEYNVAVKIDKNPPVVGDNNVSIEVTDASGHHAGDAKVTVEYSMPAMPGMPAMNYKAAAELKGDEYKAKMNLSMSGSWNVAVKITRAGKTSTAKFTVDAK
ncbi:MAG TPA: FixH family protein [Thermodesulfovibrionales bacterium]|nr:FixH family protein [Thermodesulfovibrionales bacterium]